MAAKSSLWTRTLYHKSPSTLYRLQLHKHAMATGGANLQYKICSGCSRPSAWPLSSLLLLDKPGAPLLDPAKAQSGSQTQAKDRTQPQVICHPSASKVHTQHAAQLLRMSRHHRSHCRPARPKRSGHCCASPRSTALPPLAHMLSRMPDHSGAPPVCRKNL